MTELLIPPAPKHYYGWRAPLPGRGALDLLPHVDVSELKILPQVDPRPHMPPALDQGQLGSCTANATARCFRYDTIMDALLGVGKDCGELSRLWIYYFERALEGTLSQGDCGAEGHDAFTVAKHGIPDESLYPYDIAKFEAKPPDVEPRAYKLTKPVHAVPQDIDQIKAVLSNNQTIAYGFTVYPSFEEPWSVEGEMPEPKEGEGVLGGHENLLCGYLEEYPEHLLSLNSWGTPWGIFGGYFLFPIKTFLNTSQVSDLRTIVRVA